MVKGSQPNDAPRSMTGAALVPLPGTCHRPWSGAKASQRGGEGARSVGRPLFFVGRTARTSPGGELPRRGVLKHRRRAPHLTAAQLRSGAASVGAPVEQFFASEAAGQFPPETSGGASYKVPEEARTPING